MLRIARKTTKLCTIGLLIYSVQSIQVAATEENSQIIVRVTGVASKEGKVDCALFPSKDGFPMNPSRAIRKRKDAKKGAVECLFENLSAGQYAVSVSHDKNDNGKTDTNFFGIPKEAWGVSNNARPLMRAPEFDEAVFDLEIDETLNIEIAIK